MKDTSNAAIARNGGDELASGNGLTHRVINGLNGEHQAAEKEKVVGAELFAKRSNFRKHNPKEDFSK